MVINPELKKEIPIGITICDIFGWRFNSKGIQIIIALIASIFYIPYVQAQIAGIAMALKYLGIGFEFEPAVIISAIIAFIYIAVVGIRSTAYVSILKDVLLLLAIVAVGFAAGMAMPGGVGGIFHAAAIKMPKLLNVTTNPITAGATFTISTIIFQMLGFYMSPNAVQAVLTSKGTKNLRLYMVMFPFLVITAYFALLTVPGLKQADYALLAVTVKLLPPWVVGLVAGGTALTGIIGVAVRALAVGGLFSKNVLGVIKPELDQKYMVGWTQAVTGLFIIVSVIVTLYYLTLLATITNIAYSGISQSFVCFMLAFFWKGSTKWGGAGLLASMLTIAFIHPPYRLNNGLIALIVNFKVAIAVSFATTPLTGLSSTRVWAKRGFGQLLERIRSIRADEYIKMAFLNSIENMNSAEIIQAEEELKWTVK